MRLSRYRLLDSWARVRLARKVRDLALAEKARTGKPVLYLTHYQIGRQLGESQQTVTNALRLAKTAEFWHEWGWGFVDQGNGRDGSQFGLILVEKNAPAADGELRDQIGFVGFGQLDHLRGVEAYCEQLGLSYGPGTKKRKKCVQISQQLVGICAGLESVIDDTNDL